MKTVWMAIGIGWMCGGAVIALVAFGYGIGNGVSAQFDLQRFDRTPIAQGFIGCEDGKLIIRNITFDPTNAAQVLVNADPKICAP